MKLLSASKSFIWIFIILGSIFLTQCSEDENSSPSIVLEVDSNGNSHFNRNSLQNALANLPKEELSNTEKESLLFMREEEKLAHDVYRESYILWGTQVFDHISASELTHAEAVLLLLDRYDLADPVGLNGIGVFENSNLQQLYDDLTREGLVSEIEALKVGGAIEEIDILDLERLSNTTDNQDVRMVFNNLLKGSRNHLRAFVRNLENKGLTYEPGYLSQDKFDEIIGGNMETGG